MKENRKENMKDFFRKQGFGMDDFESIQQGNKEYTMSTLKNTEDKEITDILNKEFGEKVTYITIPFIS